MRAEKNNISKVNYILVSCLIASLPFLLIPFLKSSFSEIEMILYLSINTIVSLFVVFDFGLGVKIISLLSSKKFLDMNELFSIHFFYLLLSTGIGIFLFIFSEYILQYILGNIDYLNLFRLLLLCVPIRIYLIFLKNVSLGIGDYNNYNFFSLAAAAAKLISGYLVFIGFLGFDFFVIAFVLSTLIEVMYFLNIKEYLKVRFSFLEIFNLLGQHKIIFIISLVSVVSQYADRLTIPAILIPSDLENFLLAIMFANLVFLIMNPINQLFNIDIAKNIEKAEKTFKKTLIILSILFFLGAVFFPMIKNVLLVYWFDSNDKLLVNMTFIMICTNLIFHVYGLFYFYCYHNQLRVFDFLSFNLATAVLFFILVGASYKIFGILGIPLLVFVLNSSKLLIHSFLVLRTLSFYFALYFLMISASFLWVF